MSNALCDQPEISTEPDPDPSAGLPEGLLDRIAEQVPVLEQAAEAFQQAQSLLPLPSPEDVAAMRRGDKPVTREVYLLAQLQIASVRVENVASDLRIDLEYGFKPVEFDLVPSFFNAVESAVERLSASEPVEGACR